MRLTRRSTLVSGSALAVASTASIPALAGILPQTGRVQRLDHPVIDADESGSGRYNAVIAIDAPDTMWATREAMSESDYRAAAADYRARGYGLRRVNAFRTQGGVRYAAIWQWRHRTDSQTHHDMTQGEFLAAADRYAAQGYGLAHIDGCATADGVRFAAVWDKSAALAQKVFVDLTAAQYKRQAAALMELGYRPKHVSGYSDGARARFAAVFVKDGTDRVALHALSVDQYRARMRAMTRGGYKLKDASGYVVAGQPFYTGVWERA
jgi:hypothetical protein